MHPERNIIALKAQGKTLQVFDLQNKEKLKSAVMTEDIVYWNWFSNESLGMVTATSVYHFNVFDATQAQPVKIFDRVPNLSVSWCPNILSSLFPTIDRCLAGLSNHQLSRYTR